jgi:hypothetical protein
MYHILFVIMNISNSCSANPPKHHSGGPCYYKSWTNSYLPYRSVDEISLSEAAGFESRGYL